MYTTMVKIPVPWVKSAKASVEFSLNYRYQDEQLQDSPLFEWKIKKKKIFEKHNLKKFGGEFQISIVLSELPLISSLMVQESEILIHYIAIKLNR